MIWFISILVTSADDEHVSLSERPFPMLFIAKKFWEIFLKFRRPFRCNKISYLLLAIVGLTAKYKTFFGIGYTVIKTT